MYALEIYYLVPNGTHGEWKKSKKNLYYKTMKNLYRRMEREAKELFSFYADVRFEVFCPGIKDERWFLSREDILRRFPGE